MVVPKFRAWHKAMQRMSEVLAISYERQKVKIKHQRGTTHMTIPLDDVILMQSTGLVDVNGKEIFEGDVVESTWFNDYDDCVGYRKAGTVVYRNGYFGIEYPGDVEKRYSPTILDFAVSVEIIGNVHQNPELVEG